MSTSFNNFEIEKERRFMAEMRDAVSVIADKYEMSVDVHSINIVNELSEDEEQEDLQEFASNLEGIYEPDDPRSISSAQKDSLLNKAISKLQLSGIGLPDNFLSNCSEEEAEADEQWIISRIKNMLGFSEVKELFAYGRSLTVSYLLPHGFIINTHYASSTAKAFNLEKARSYCFRSAVNEIRQHESYIDFVKAFVNSKDESDW